MANERKVTKIPATKHRYLTASTTTLIKRKVAAYARVSTDSDEQFTSYEAQIDYYTKYIKEHRDWEMVSIYTDEGISGTNTKHRTGFNQMIEDALAGKIDLIVTKSVSRFARNTVDSLTTIRKLKEHNVEVFFEKESIWTFDGKGELLISIMSSIAQEESRSISENVTWGQRKRFADGKVNMPYKNFLGYRKGADGNPEVVEDEAAIVRIIYRLFLEGQTPRSICQYLMDNSILSPGHKQLWRPSTVSSILTNEKYRGDAVLQKCFTTDFLTKKQKKNEGEVPQYLVKNSHPPIIAPIEFDMVQAEFERRKRMGTRYSCAHALSSKLVCGDCGGFYTQKVWHSNDPGRRLVWQCNDKFKGDKKCQTPSFSEEQIKALFLKAYNQFVGDRAQLMADCTAMMETVADTSEQDKAIADIMTQLNDSALRIRACISEHAETAQTEEAFEAKRQPLVEQHSKLEAQLQRAESKKANKLFRERQIRTFIESLRSAPLVLTEWDDTVWQLLLDKGTVAQDGSIAFEFKDGTVVTAK